MNQSGATVIARHALIKGELHFSGPTVIAGRVEGHITSQDVLEISPEGQVEGDIHGVVVDIQGTVNGNVAASRTCRLGVTARVTGELRAANLATAEGASYGGKLYLGNEYMNALPSQTMGQPQTVSQTINRLETLTADVADMTQAAAAMALVEQAPAEIPAESGVRIVPQAVHQTVSRSPKIIKAR